MLKKFAVLHTSRKHATLPNYRVTNIPDLPEKIKKWIYEIQIPKQILRQIVV